MLSSGGLLRATSFEMSPVVLFAADALEPAPLPKIPAILDRWKVDLWRRKAENAEGRYGCQSMCYRKGTILLTLRPRSQGLNVLNDRHFSGRVPARLRLGKNWLGAKVRGAIKVP